ncbi:UNVERIFIED_CONTAM: hypothetical protein K2H54_010515 [Gekko kuhli]
MTSKHGCQHGFMLPSCPAQWLPDVPGSRQQNHSVTHGRSPLVHERPENGQDAAGYREAHESTQQERDFSNSASSRGIRPHDPRSHRTPAHHDRQHIRNGSDDRAGAGAHFRASLPPAKCHLFEFIRDYYEHRRGARGGQRHRSANDFECLRHLRYERA